MFYKRNWLHSIILGSCPRCRQERMYQVQNPYHLGTVLDMKEICSSCKLKFKIEPSFFFGAMYVSYSLGVALGVAVFVISYFLFSTSPIGSILAIAVTLIIFAPFIMRISRNIWINLFINYKGRNSNNIEIQSAIIKNEHSIGNLK